MTWAAVMAAMGRALVSEATGNRDGDRGVGARHGGPERTTPHRRRSLTRIYAKLGLRSRTELARRAN